MVDGQQREFLGGSGGGAWSFTHGYDQFGNMWVSATTGLTAHSATPRAGDQFGATTNRLTKAFDGSMLSNPYDEAGNLINHPYVGAMQYDAENRQKQFTSGSTTATYHYDGNGRRVKRVLGGQTTVFVYDALGNLAAEYSTAPAETGGRRYRTTDHLGSTRLVTDHSGAVKTRHDYVPFGEELPASSSAGNRNLVFGFGVSPSERHKFTGKERDVESGLDYFGARYMSSAQGRFTSADAPFADQYAGAPQSWNLYSYVRGNPLRFRDPNGRECVTTDSGSTADNQQNEPCQAVQDSPPQQETVYAHPQLNPLVAQELRSAAQRAKRDINTFAISSVVAGTAVGGGLALSTPAALTQLGVSSGPIFVGLSRAERLMVQEMEAAGNIVQVIPRAAEKTADFLINGIRTELKTLSRAGTHTLKNAIEKAAKQGENIIVDARNVNMSPQNALQEVQRAQGNVGGLQGRVTVLTRDGAVKY